MSEETKQPETPMSRAFSRIVDVHGNPMAAMDSIRDAADASYEESVLAQRVRVSLKKVEEAIAFWKPFYLEETIEGRQLNGAEAYDLGDPAKTEKPEPICYIAMCNLMTLEALRRMGDRNPSVEHAEALAFGSETEQEICDWWHEVFAPTAFQANWAWKTALAIMAGEPSSTDEVLENYRNQLP